jgi:hypothetical protein
MSVLWIRQMYDWINNIRSKVEPIEDPFYGSLYRCSLTLNDGTVLPCAVIQPKQRLVDLAKRRIKEEMEGKGRIGGDDPYGQIVTTFVARGNRVNDYDVASSDVSKYATPLALLKQIHGETFMGWTGWVFRMRGGRVFSYGSSFRAEFLQLPDGYDFNDVVEVINHSFVDSGGAVVALSRGALPPANYHRKAVLRERAFFMCAVDGVQ